ncbi:MAG: PAS domain-containing protein [Microgenomates group bacterium]|jgi:hypothetical protein
MPNNKSAVESLATQNIVAINLFNNLPQKIFYKDKDLNYVLCNENYAKDLKIKASEISGKSDFDFYPKELAEKYRADDKLVLKSGEKKEVEEAYEVEGQKYWVQTVKVPIKEKGQTIGILGIFWDITERKKTGLELLFRDEIIKNLAEGIYLIRASDGTIVYTNPKFEKMFGFNSGEMIGKPASIVNAPTDKKPEETAKEIMGILAKTGEWHGEVNNVKKDGTPFWCYANVSVFDHSEYGKVLVAVHTDITERKKAEEQAKEAFDAQEKMNKLMVGRELKMIELKERVKELEGGMNLKNKIENLSWKDKFREGENIEEIFVTKIKGLYFDQINQSKLADEIKEECKKLLQVLIDDSTRHLAFLKQMEKEQTNG